MRAASSSSPVARSARCSRLSLRTRSSVARCWAELICGCGAQMQDRLLAGPHRHALIGRRQIAAAPGRRAALESAARIGQHDERRQVAVLAPQAISHPTADARPAHQDAAGVHLIDRLRMIHAVAVQAADHAQLVGMFGDLRQEVADLQARLAARPKRLDRREQRILGHFAPRHHHAEALGQRLAGVLHEVGLGIEQIDMARPAVHEQPDHPLHARLEMGLARAIRRRGGFAGCVGGAIVGQERCQRERPNPPPAWARNDRRERIPRAAGVVMLVPEGRGFVDCSRRLPIQPRKTEER